MEISKGNSLCSYLYLKLKCHCFILSFLLFLLQNQRTGGKKKSLLEGRVGTGGKGYRGKGVGR
jgi:hypothetical protein